MKFIFASIIMYFLSACTVVTPHISEYIIDPVLEENSYVSTCNNRSLKVLQSFSSSSLMSTKMYYVLGDYKRDAFTESQWAESPNRAITNRIVSMLQNSKLFSTVQVSKSRTKSDLFLETNVEDFVQYFSQDEKKSYVKAVITMTLIDAKNKKILNSKTFEKRVDSTSIDAQGGVVALNKALLEILLESQKWIVGVCK